MLKYANRDEYLSYKMVFEWFFLMGKDEQEQLQSICNMNFSIKKQEKVYGNKTLISRKSGK